MRLPGGVQTAESFWDLLDGRREGRCRVPATRYNVGAFYGPGRPGHVCSEYGHFLQDVDLAEVDTSFWSMTRQEVEEMDNQQRLALEVRVSSELGYDQVAVQEHWHVFRHLW